MKTTVLRSKILRLARVFALLLACTTLLLGGRAGVARWRRSKLGAQDLAYVPRGFRRRIVAIGDLHGDLNHAVRTLRNIEVINEHNHWIGKSTILVQTGDIVDRGKDTIALYHFFETLRSQAAEVGGQVVSLMGNHEMMNAMGDWRYVTKEDIESFGGERNRRRAMSSRGWIGQNWLANYTFTARVQYNLDFKGHAASPYLNDSLEDCLSDPIDGQERRCQRQIKARLSDHAPQRPLGIWRGPDKQTLFSSPDAETTEEEHRLDPFAGVAASFVHGGIHPEWAAKPNAVGEINKLGHSLLEKSISGPLASPLSLPRNASPEERALWEEKGPLWYRGFALDEDETEMCARAAETMRSLGVRRLIMGHTPQFEGIKSRCAGQVILIDTGISSAYGGALAALEIMYTLTPARDAPRPLGPDGQETPPPVPKPGEKRKWAERELVSVWTVGKRTQIIARKERTLHLPAI
ncbi:uncharacterized protein L969DRAFT_97102 [Mixia osmundae IAM 14324]|uniref:Calcineurin-like phosphoesterase domain-containing protein n=1 Tax=Mixia osmundae (strain CBS 9802 / IAM 14324 / JCM 22182 / KY 12970) TaxID=764103 RepID=G7E1P3_MIXOS|nr:uncharacterized protein L969DRAFT_97102 [Mixia osmundae IAM 14324]KEI36703.1 hypothetical protein L969DRAFT_97102 [Mixia osmundae IAM 14324]GAA96753.1 hypothetical protein E5Q_03424 [Mixia osmundae IAM 14324]